MGRRLANFWTTVCKTIGSPYALGQLSCLSVLSCPVLSVTLMYCGQTVGWTKMKLGMQVGLGPGHVIVLDADPAPLPKNGEVPPPQFLAHVYCQTAGWIKMALAMEVGLGPGNIVLDGDPATPKRGTAPIFGPCLLWPNDCTTW